MWHLFDYVEDGITKRIRSAMVATGENAIDTAMSKTVGLPLGIATKLLIQRKIEARGVSNSDYSRVLRSDFSGVRRTWFFNLLRRRLSFRNVSAAKSFLSKSEVEVLHHLVSEKIRGSTIQF